MSTPIRTKGSFVRRFAVAVAALSTTAILATGGIAQAATTNVPENQLMSPAPRVACDYDNDRIQDVCMDTNNNDAMDVVLYDDTGNGNFDEAYVDTDHDGIFEWVFLNADDDNSFERAAVDTDADGQPNQTYRHGKDGLWYPDTTP